MNSIDLFAKLMREINQCRRELLTLADGAGVSTPEGKRCLLLAEAVRKAEDDCSEAFCSVTR